MAAIPLEREIEYPTSDGEPMAETPHHRLVMTDLIQGFENLYAEDENVWVGGNCFFCYREGDPEAAVAPDVLVVKGVAKNSGRRNYLLWEERRVPSLVMEVTSRKTRRQDGEKKNLYEWLGVEEYFRFDPFEEYLKPKFQGFRLENGVYRPIPAGMGGALESRATGVTMRPEGERVRLTITTTGERLLWNDEQEAARKAAEAHAAEEREARQAAESHAKQAESRAVQAESRAAEAESRAAEEAAARQALEAELDRLRRKLQGD
jgi:Uma2 family endonuclease